MEDIMEILANGFIIICMFWYYFIIFKLFQCFYGTLNKYVFVGFIILCTLPIIDDIPSIIFGTHKNTSMYIYSVVINVIGLIMSTIAYNIEKSEKKDETTFLEDIKTFFNIISKNEKYEENND